MTTNVIVVNQKGGVGKTTFADEIAWGLERRGVEVGFGNLDRQGGGVLQQVPLFVYGGSCFMAGIFRVRQVRLILAGRVRRINVKKS